MGSKYHILSLEQEGVGAELSFSALIVSHDGRQVVGRGRFKKTRSQQQRLPPVPHLHIPPEAGLRAFVNTDLKRRSFGGGLRVIIYNLLQR